LVLIEELSVRKSEAIQFAPHEIIHVMAENDQSIFRGTSKLKPLLKADGTLSLHA
jgi:hypothetical protein